MDLVYSIWLGIVFGVLVFMAFASLVQTVASEKTIGKRIGAGTRLWSLVIVVVVLQSGTLVV